MAYFDKNGGSLLRSSSYDSFLQSLASCRITHGGMMAAAMSLILVSLPVLLLRFRERARHNMHMEELMNLNAAPGQDLRKLQKQVSDPDADPNALDLDHSCR